MPFDGPPPALEAGGEVLSGAALAALAVARTAVNRHWSDAIASASEAMQASLQRLTAALTPSWNKHLQPSATWQVLVDTCGHILGSTNGDAIMELITRAKKASLWIRKAPMSDIIFQPQPHQHVRPIVSTAQDISTTIPRQVCVHRRQVRHSYALVCRSSGRARDAEGLVEAEMSLRAGLVVVHEAMLYKSATAEEGAIAACQKTLVLIGKRDLSADVNPKLYEMARAISIS
jgi:hypothetical protein